MPYAPEVHSDAVDRQVLSCVIQFLAVVEHRSFTRAAAALDVTPTAVSKAVRQFERRHGVVLFQRTTRSVALTEAGTALLARLRPAVAEMNFAPSALGSYQAQPTSGTSGQPGRRISLRTRLSVIASRQPARTSAGNSRATVGTSP
jgi:DNA-binding transcriptional LysR family regulator